jgi:cytochrome-b5 reductase
LSVSSTIGHRLIGGTQISGGTGITPFFQLFNKVISGSTSPRTRFTLLHSSRRPGELPPPAILQPLVTYAEENPNRFKLQLFVDSMDGSNVKTRIRVGRIDKSAIENSLRRRTWSWWGRNVDDRRILVLVCGPEG